MLTPTAPVRACVVLQSAARQEASQQRRLDKKKAEREKRDQLEPEALVRAHNPLLYLAGVLG